jgi:ankyrin repeat protein
MPNTEPENKILYEAVARGDMSTVQELIADGINVYQLAYGEWDESWKYFITPLEKAVQLGNKEILQVLLTSGAKFPYWQQEYLCRALKIASYFGNLELVQLLLQIGSENQKQMATQALAFALEKEHNNIARALIEVGADLNWESEWGRPLEVAARNGNINLVKLLVEAGVDVNAICDEPPYIGSLGIAANCGHQEVFDYLFPLVSNQEEREYAQKELTQGIIRKQRRENKLLNEFFKALGEGSTQGEGDVEAVRRLISAGVDINAFCETGKTAIHLAVFWDSIRMIKLLAELGADLDILDESGGSTPLMMAVTGRQAWAVRALIRSGANVNARNRYGYTALFIAEKDPDTPLVIKKILLKAGATL